MTQSQEIITLVDLAIIFLGITAFSGWLMWRSTKVRPRLSAVERDALSLATVDDRRRLTKIIRRDESVQDRGQAILVIGRAAELQVTHRFSLQLGVAWLILSTIALALGIAWASPAAEVIAAGNVVVSLIQIPAAVRLARLARRAEQRHREIVTRVNGGEAGRGSWPNGDRS